MGGNNCKVSQNLAKPFHVGCVKNSAGKSATRCSVGSALVYRQSDRRTESPLLRGSIISVSGEIYFSTLTLT